MWIIFSLCCIFLRGVAERALGAEGYEREEGYCLQLACNARGAAEVGVVAIDLARENERESETWLPPWRSLCFAVTVPRDDEPMGETRAGAPRVGAGARMRPDGVGRGLVTHL